MVNFTHAKKTVILHAVHKVFATKKYFFVALGTALFMFSVFILLPVGRFSTTAFYYQVTSLDSFSLLNLLFFSVILGILFAMNFYLLMKKVAQQKRIGSILLSLFSSFFAGIFGSSVCTACLTLLFGFLGIPTIAFLVTYRKSFFLLAAVIALAQLYFTSRTIMSYTTCKVCKIPLRK